MVTKEELNQNAEELVLYVNNFYEAKAEVDKLRTLRNPIKSLLHSEDCDDEYQEQLEISWELRDQRDNMDKYNKLAKNKVEWFVKVGYPNALKEYAKRYSKNLVKYLKLIKL